MPVGSPVDFTISLPADVVGADDDVQLDCRGRVVRSFDEHGRRGIGVVIDEFGEAEIHDARLIKCVEQNVRWLEIAM